MSLAVFTAIQQKMHNSYAHLYWSQSCVIFVKRLSISVDDATHVRLKVLAAESGTTMNAIVEAAVKEHLFKSVDVAPDSATEEPL